MTIRSQGQPSLSPLRGAAPGNAQPRSAPLGTARSRSADLSPSGPVAEDAKQSPSPGKGSSQLLQPRAFQQAVFQPAQHGWQQLMGEGRLPTTANQKAAGCSGQGEQHPQPHPVRTLVGGNLWSVSGATCVRWDWLASQPEGSRLASEDGAIPRACGLASARQSSLKPEGLPLGLDQSQCALASEK